MIITLGGFIEDVKICWLSTISSYEQFVSCNDPYVGQPRLFKMWMSGLSFAYRVFAYLIMNTNMHSILISWQLILIRAVPTPWHHCLRWEKATVTDWKCFCLLSLHPSPTQLLVSMINPLRLPGTSPWYNEQWYNDTLEHSSHLTWQFSSFSEIKMIPST